MAKLQTEIVAGGRDLFYQVGLLLSPLHLLLFVKRSNLINI
jgi:hypothetical protein